MHVKKFKVNFRVMVIFSLAFISATLSILHVIIGSAKTPLDSIYLWIPHYYLDYFVFVGGIAQGIRGNWLLENPYSISDTSRTIMAWWQYVLYGKIAGIFNISPTFFYTLVIFLISFFIVWLMYLIIKNILSNKSFKLQVLALIFALAAGPFFELSKNKAGFSVVPYNFWSSPATFFDRFDPIPHHLLSTLLVLLLIILTGSTLEKINGFTINKIFFTAFYLALLIIFLLTFSPFQVVNYLLALASLSLFVLLRKSYKAVLFTFFVLIFIVPVALILKIHHSNIPMLVASSQADKGYQIHPSLRDFLLTTGPLLIFAPFGLYSYFRKLSATRLLLFSFVVTSYVLFSSKLAEIMGSHNIRFLTPVSYLLFGVLSMLGMIQILQKIAKKFSYTVYIAVFLVFLLFLPPNILGFYVKLEDKNIFPETAYLKKNIIAGLNFLDKIKDDKTVLTSPSIMIGAVLPVFMHKKVYLGRHSFTPNYEEKKVQVTHFYNGWIKEAEAKEYVVKNKIGTIVITSMEGFSFDLDIHYSFLKEIYKNKDIIIFKVT